MSCVEFIDISKSYGDTSFVAKLSLSLPECKTTAIIGGSGSGKSTLLKMINGLVRPDEGKVILLGQDLNYENLSEQRKNMGYAVQGAGLFPHMTSYDNVTLMARLAGWHLDKIQQRYEYLLNLLELPTSLSQRFPYSLSGGQQQRVSLCRAMMLNPPVLLLDEPFSALDPITRGTIHEEFLTLRSAEERSIILVTHDMQEATKLAHNLVILDQGAVVQQGSIDEVSNEPATDYVAKLLDRVAAR